ncbi:MAG: hypothetical protein CMF26_06880 [Kiloniella sp.]|nr:hypothetical protein [Kiloniella sp.]
MIVLKWLFSTIGVGMTRLGQRALVIAPVMAAGAAYLLLRDQMGKAVLSRSLAAEAALRHSRILLELKEAQDEARASAARSEPDLLERLRNSAF